MAEVKIAMAGLQWVASPIVNKLFAKASTYLGADVARELQDLETTVLPQFDLMIEAAEKSPHRDKLMAWLQRLKNTYYDTEDLLDDHEYNILERKAKSGKDPLLEEDGSSIASTIRKPFRAAKNKASNLLGKNRKLIDKIKELKAILAEAKQFRELLRLPAGNASGPHTEIATSVPLTTSLPTSKVFGRDKDRDRIVDILLSKTAAAEESSASYSCLSIVGAGGMGKSTLAQYLYNDKRIEEYFDVRMWVCISRKLDVHRHTREIIESATKGECPHVDNLDTLHGKLKDILQSKKFLLVLDDVWFHESDNEAEWETLLAPLVSLQAGSKVLVTSRRDTLPGALCCKHSVVHLENIEDAQFLALFKHHAFSGAEIGDQVRVKLEDIAEKIAKKLGKSPLAAKVMGSQLRRKKDITAWRDSLRSNNLSEPMRALLWSYEQLDPHMQRCFLYCSLFPKGHKFRMNELVHLWVAEGFVDSFNLSKRMEDVGEDYFTEMLSGSFFQLVSDDSFGSFYGDSSCSRYIMHDLLHDLAESLSKEDCFRLEDDNVTEIPCTIRHLSVGVERMEKHKHIISKLKHLRTIICIDTLMDDANCLFDKMLSNLKKLRVLNLSLCNSRKLPESVGELKHLRYLDLFRTCVSELPESLSTLYHLQLLHVDQVWRFPDAFDNLTKLRHLVQFSPDGIPNIGKLTSLQRLHYFFVQKEKGYELRQLRDMNELGGTLRVINLENVTEKDEALESKLYKKNRLKHLELVWSSKNGMDVEDSLHLEIIDALKPPPQLSGLSIQGYKSGTYPSWLLERSYLESLESFELVCCPVLEGLPPDTDVLSHCSKLHLQDVPNLKTLPYLPAGLIELRMNRCPQLMFVTKIELEQYNMREYMMKADDLGSKLARILEASLIPQFWAEEIFSLRQLETLMECDISEHLQTILRAAQSRDNEWLKENTIKAWLCCHEQRIGLLYGRSVEQPLFLPSGLHRLDISSCSITDGALVICLGGLTSLQDLKLCRIMTLTALPSEEVFEHLTKLTMLTIDSCWGLRSLGGLAASTSVLSLIFRTCPCLELAHGERLLPLSLRSLDSFRCVLGADILRRDLPNLNTVSLSHCRSSETLLVGHLTSVKEFTLCYFPDLCRLEGLSSLQLELLTLQGVQKLTTECISPLRVQQSLVTNSVLLKRMLSAESFTVPPYLALEFCNEPSISFEGSANFSSLKHLKLNHCGMESLPRNLMRLSSLERLDIHFCLNITFLPDLPPSLRRISVRGCEALKKNCQAPNGESWPKISHIRWKDFDF